MRKTPDPNVKRPNLDAEVNFVSPCNRVLGFGPRFHFSENVTYAVLNELFPVKTNGIVCRLYNLCLKSPVALTTFNRVFRPKKYEAEIERRREIKIWVDRLRKQNLERENDE